MSKTIYDTDFTTYLPEALKKDPKMVALAKAATDELLKASGLVDDVLIYSRFDELPEELVDILAYDLHVDWYDFNYPLEAKRDLVKNSVKVHKKMGTKYAIETALGSLFSGSEVEEWFQYNGEPGHFHIILDVTNQRITASYQEIIRAVKLYKRLSAHMDELTYQGSIHTEIRTHGEYYRYSTPLTGRLNAGTYPYRNMKGKQDNITVIVGSDNAGFIFHAPAAGTMPYRNTVFGNSTAHIDAETALNVFEYRNTPAGKKKAGETPQRSQKGQTNSAEVTMQDAAEAFTYKTAATGTVPERSTTQRTQGGAVENSVQATGYSYTVKSCGSTRKL
ncbi:MAG: phage tail protein I [Phascolarctobacterium sp.]|nr:phage tail protein I [Candidatus Phascolarctobacterium caballi]